MNLEKLYSVLRKKRGKAKILTSVVVIIGEDDQGQDIQAKIVFVRDRNRSKKIVFTRYIIKSLLGVQVCES